jgi:hypothetical protein
MKSHNANLDIFRHSDANLARVYRIDADAQRHSPYFTERERIERERHCIAIAMRHEARMRADGVAA